MEIKRHLKGCWHIITTTLGIIIIGIIVLAIFGFIGELMFDLVNQRK